MPGRRYLSLLLFLCFVLGGVVGAKDLEVRVALYRGKDEARFSSASGLLVTVGRRAFSVPAGMPVGFSLREGKVFWKEKGVLAPSFTLTPRGGEPLLWGKRPYRGKMVLEERNGMLLLVNVLPLEDYLKGTIKLEASPSWPEEALKAQIVVARTYALKNLGRHREEGFDFCTTEHCQRYGGINAEDSRTNPLVERTRGIVLTYEGKLASVVYHAESGGYTDSAYNVWRKEVPYLVGVPSPWEEDAPHAHWTVSLSRSEVEAALRRAGYLPGALQGIQFVPGENGRMKEVVLFSRGGRWVIPASKFREALGVNLLLSTYFTVTEEGPGEQPASPPQEEEPLPESQPSEEVASSRELLKKPDWTLDDILTFLALREKEREQKKGRRSSPKPQEGVPALPLPPKEEGEGKEERFVFEGRGWGHGVGLSQWGAVGMAREGYTFQEILAHYFPGCALGRAVLR
ncbi:MAG: SpoIID/LytB domain-containing protein [Candidatus Caldatribacteriaceae bacterium]